MCKSHELSAYHAQEALSYLQAMGAVSKLPDDAQWSIRALLMRRLSHVVALPRVSQPAQGGAGDPALPQLLGFLLQQMSKVRKLCSAFACRIYVKASAKGCIKAPHAPNAVPELPPAVPAE